MIKKILDETDIKQTAGDDPKAVLSQGATLKAIDDAIDDALKNFTPSGDGGGGGLTEESDPTVPEWAKQPNKPTYTAEEVGADPLGRASSAVSAHNADGAAHNDIRLLITALTNRLNAFLDVDDETLDELSEVIGIINDNSELIAQITTNKVSVSDIVNNLTTNVSNKPLSAAQGVALKALIDAITVPTKLSQLTNDSGFITKTVSDLVNYYKKSEVYSRDEIDKKGFLTEHQDISGKLEASKLPEAINGALAQAKESGEFDGEDGARGTGILKVTTAPTSYTTSAGGKTPIKRMALSTIKSQSGVNEVLVGDLIEYSYYHYHVYYLDATYAYMDTSQSIRGAAGTSVTVSSVSESTESGGTNVVTFSDGKKLNIKNGKDGKSAYELWLAEGNEGTEADFLESLKIEAADLPRIFFTGKFPSNKNEGEWLVRMTYISRAKQFTAYATAKVQGSSSMSFKKKNYTFKLYEDEGLTEKKKVTFRNWSSENKFVAKANTIDRTHSRNVVTCRIWGDMVKSRKGYSALPEALRNSPNLGAIDGFPVKMYLNGVYQGLYTWNIPKDDWMAGLDSDLVDQHAIICGEGNTNSTTGQKGDEQITFNAAYPNLTQVISGYDWADELETVGTNIRNNWKAFSDLIVNGTDSAFISNLSTYVDVESLIDSFIFKWLVCDVDGLGKNQFFYTYNAGLPWYSGVYDLDSTWGMTPAGSSLTAYDTVMQDGYLYPKNKGLYNMLYKRLWELFTDDIRERWNSVKNGALGLANIINHFETFRDVIPEELFAEDSAETTAGGAFITTDDSSHKGFDSVLGIDKSNLQQIRNFAAARWAYVDGQINLIKCQGITLSATKLALTKDNATVAITATLTPSDCNETVVWASNDENVATVGGGTITAIYNGSCTITATCGDYSATCEVTVSGFETAGSTNLADPTSEDWQKGYVVENNSNPTKIIAANRTWRTVTNYIEFRVGDVFTINGCQALYGNSSYGYYGLYDLEKTPLQSMCVSIMQNNGDISVVDGVTTVHITRELITNMGLTIGGGFIRFQLGIYDGQSDIDTDNIVILRNPNGENADAWA